MANSPQVQLIKEQMFTILLHLLNYENSALSDADTANRWGQKHYWTHSLLDCLQNPPSQTKQMAMNV